MTASPPHPATEPQAQRGLGATERRAPVGGTSLLARTIGQARPIVIQHGRPDFDHRYLLPDLDRLRRCHRDAFGRVYYDGRVGRSGSGVRRPAP